MTFTTVVFTFVMLCLHTPSLLDQPAYVIPVGKSVSSDHSIITQNVHKDESPTLNVQHIHSSKASIISHITEATHSPHTARTAADGQTCSAAAFARSLLPGTEAAVAAERDWHACERRALGEHRLGSCCQLLRAAAVVHGPHWGIVAWPE